MDYKQRAEDFIAKSGVSENSDQHFLVDSTVIDTIAKHITSQDIVLEIGPGLGFITAAVAKKAKEVVVLERDQRFKQVLNTIGCTCYFGDAQKMLGSITAITKLVGNPPFQLLENMMHYLCQNERVEAVLLMPDIFSQRIMNSPLFSAFLSVEVLMQIPGEGLYPKPKRACVLVHIRHTKQDSIARQLYLQQDKRLKNALREALIHFDTSLTKRSAKETLASFALDEAVLEKPIPRLSNEELQSVLDATSDWFRLLREGTQ